MRDLGNQNLITQKIITLFISTSLGHKFSDEGLCACRGGYLLSVQAFLKVAKENRKLLALEFGGCFFVRLGFFSFLFFVKTILHSCVIHMLFTLPI